MRLSISHLDRLQDQVVLCQLHQLLEDLALELEAREMSAVGHHSERLSDDQSIETDIEYGAHARN